MSAIFRTSAVPRIPAKLILLRFNRLLAWGGLISPLVQWQWRMSLQTGFFVDLGMVIAHCLLSLHLFGIPKRKGGGFEAEMHVFGARARPMSPRNDFLTSGYRIFLGMIWSTVFLLPPVFWMGAVGGVYVFLRMPLTVAEHVAGATTLALRRVGVTDLAESYAVVITVLYIGISMWNVVMR